MKKLIDIGIDKIKPSGKYIFVLEPYMGGGDILCFVGTGKQAIEKLKGIFDYENSKEEYEEETGKEYPIKDFLRKAESYNGDGYDFIQVYKG